MLTIRRFGTALLAATALLLIVRLAGPGGWIGSWVADGSLLSFKRLFLGILLEALPFVLLGVLVSALLQVFVPDGAIARFAPRHPVAGALFGSLLGLVLPLCECGMIPVVRRLIRKGMPAPVGLVYIFAGPVVNPVVFAATHAAFPDQPLIAYMRITLAFAVCFALGLLLSRCLIGSPLKHDLASLRSGAADDRSHGSLLPDRAGGRFGAVLAHASDEFFDIGKYLIPGALVASLMQLLIEPGMLAPLAANPVGAGAFMMGLAFLLSLCSNSDAFVVAPLAGIFPSGALLAFLVFGPMVDLKSVFLLLSAFRIRPVAGIILFLFAAVLAGSLIAQAFVFPH